MEHGASAYTNHSCRCSICRNAHRERSAKRREERKHLLLEDPDLAPHGRNSTYTNWACRCEQCRDAHARKKQIQLAGHIRTNLG